jgi:hypothetical protein
MRLPVFAVIGVLCGGLAVYGGRSAAARGAGGSDGAATPVLVELFTSEGCSDCPPADSVLARLGDGRPVAGALVVALGEHVDYWDQLGWRDRFSSALFTNRQQLYGAHFNLDSVYTPQMVVDGRLQFVGSDEKAARTAIERSAAQPHGTLSIAVEPPTASGSAAAKASSVNVAVTAGGLPRPGRGDVTQIYVAVTENHVTSEVKRGENRGKTLAHTAVVRSLTRIGEAGNPAVAAPLRGEITLGADWRRDQLKLVAFAQEQRGRAIVAAAAVPLQNPAR